MVEPRKAQWVAAKHVLRYLQGTIGYGLRYTSNDAVGLHGYIDSDWAGSAMDRRSTSGCCLSLRSAMISWLSRKQTFVALSTEEAEYIATSMASREVVWLRKLLSGIFDQMLDLTIISSIYMTMKFSFSHESDIHSPLKCCTCIHQPKWHFVIHECSPWSDKCYLILFFQVHFYLVVS